MPVWPNGSHDIPRVSREFGYKSSIYAAGYHQGIDLVGFTYNCSPVNGVVITAKYNGSFGNEVAIRGDDGTVHRMGHHKSMMVKVGQRVSEGQRVGVQGATGLATGVHCHYETRPGGGSSVNPRTWMSNARAATANVGGGQRTVLSSGSANRRSGPSTSASIVGEALAPGTVGNFNGWIYGENVNGNNVWYRGISGDWFWSGGFEQGANGSGLTDLNPPAISGTQRQVLASGSANRRSAPSTQGAPTGEPLAPSTIGNFTGWAHGESVSGNDVWFQGTSGDWFWSGGFTDTGTHDLPEVKRETPLAGTQRKVLDSAPANRRANPSASAATAGDPLPPGEIGNFDAWTRGEAVQGNDVWFRGTPSGNWFWSGGFTDTGTHDLPEFVAEVPAGDKPDPAPVPATGLTGTQRQVLPTAGCNGRSGPGTTYDLVGSALAKGVIGNFDGWSEGEGVGGNSVWFRGTSGRWFWSGGFTDTSTHDLPKVSYTPPAPVPTVPSFYPGATATYSTPNGSERTPGSTIDKLYVHHCAATSDQLGYFRVLNERKSCPTFYVRANGEVVGLIRPKLRPWSTGQPDHSALAIETQNTSGAPDWGISEASHESIAKIAAWMSQQTEIDGVPVTFKLDRDHVQGHREAPGAATACPGPSMDLDRIVSRARELAEAAEPLPAPEETLPTPTPESPKVPEDLKEAWQTFRDKMDEYLS